MQADFCIFPRCARSEALELRSKLIQKANATALSSYLVEKRHEDLLVVFLRYLSNSPDTIDSTRCVSGIDL
jgi:hypothetical protein